MKDKPRFRLYMCSEGLGGEVWQVNSKNCPMTFVGYTTFIYD